MSRTGPDVRIRELEETMERLTRELAQLRGAATTPEEALRASEARYRAVIDQFDGIVYQANVLTWTPNFMHGKVKEITGYSADELVRGVVRWEQLVDPRDLPQVREEGLRLQQSRGYVASNTFRIRQRNGAVRWVHEVARCLDLDEPTPRVLQGMIVDVTAERRLQEQLIQAQKMESLGRLVAGIAHDFNNLLTTIVGYTSLARRALPPGHAMSHDLEQVEEAAHDASDLTRRLLAFSHRQSVDIRRVDLTEIVRGLEKLVRRTVGDDVEVVSVLEPHPWPVRADASQIEQVLLNLVVNARDAMPRGGRLTFETANLELRDDDEPEMGDVPRGAYVRLSVCDTGDEAGEEDREQPFDRIFTTADGDPGGGLGLSTCLAIVVQFGGHLRCHSDRDHGTAFDLLFPRISEDANDADQPEPAGGPRGAEHVLLVEDNPTVRGVAARGLEFYGYTVLVAASGDEALRLVREGLPRVDLVITDLVMPRMGGREVAERLRKLLGPVPVLFISGYFEETGDAPQDAAQDEEFLPKPFTPVSLARRVRDVLDARRQA